MIDNLYTGFYDTADFREHFTYSGNDLGMTYTKKQTSFTVWAPIAESVSVMLYAEGDIHSPDDGEKLPMQKSEGGIWTLTLPGNRAGYFYTYLVKNPGFPELEAGDPYAKAVGVNGDRSAILDLDETNPEDWEQDMKPNQASPTDAVIYELHMRDLSTHKDSGIRHVGKFLQFTESHSLSPAGIKTGINHLLELGITTIHLLPCFDFSTIDERYPERNAFNWGYDPRNYNVPEGSYSTDPYTPSVRIHEFKKMIQALHQNGIRVILDVVYNHTVDNDTSKFHRLVPGYYYRMSPEGTFLDGSFCGSETASERPMMQKYIVDSVLHWTREYHVDGFRFDLMGLHDMETMKAVRQALHEIDPSIHIYGEGWDMGHLPQELRAIQPHIEQLPGIGMFNDQVRDSLKGVFNQPSSHGFVDGRPNLELEMMKCASGSIAYNNIIHGYNAELEQSINYAEVHDNHTLWDKLELANPTLSEAARIRMDMLANAVVLTSQGVPFLSSGVEFLRTKHGDPNSFQSPDAVNQLDWERKAAYIEVFHYYSGLVCLRKSHPAFRLPAAELVRMHLVFIDSPRNTVAFLLIDHAGGDEWKHILVAYNANPTAVQLKLPHTSSGSYGEWTLVVKNLQSGLHPIELCKEASVEVPGISTIVMHTEDELAIQDLFGETRNGVDCYNGDVKSENIRSGYSGHPSRLMGWIDQGISFCCGNGKKFEMEQRVLLQNERLYLPLTELKRMLAECPGWKEVCEMDLEIPMDRECPDHPGYYAADVLEELLSIKVLVEFCRFDENGKKLPEAAPKVYVLRGV